MIINPKNFPGIHYMYFILSVSYFRGIKDEFFSVFIEVQKLETRLMLRM